MLKQNFFDKQIFFINYIKSQQTYLESDCFV